MKQFLMNVSIVIFAWGCAWMSSTTKSAAHAAINCATATVQASAPQLLPAIMAIVAGNAANWKDQVGAFTKQFGVDVTACSLRKAAASFQESIVPMGAIETPASTKAQTGITNARTYLNDQEWTFTE